MAAIEGAASAERGLEFAGGGNHGDASAEELGQSCWDAGGGGQDQSGAADRCQDHGSHSLRLFTVPAA